MEDRTKKTPSGGNVMTLFKTPLPTSMTWRTSPAAVPKRPAFLMMKSCSFSVVHSIRQVAERAGPVVMVPALRTARSSIAWMISARLEGLDWVLIPRSWSEIRDSSRDLGRRGAVEEGD